MKSVWNLTIKTFSFTESHSEGMEVSPEKIEAVSKKIVDALEDYHLLEWRMKPTAMMIVRSMMKDFIENISLSKEDGVNL